MDALRTDWIDRRQALMQGGHAERLGLLGEPAADRLVGGRTIEQTAHERLEIERGAADDQHLFAARLDLRAKALRFVEPPGNAAGFPRIEHIDEMMWDALALLRRRFRGADVHAAIEGH